MTELVATISTRPVPGTDWVAGFACVGYQVNHAITSPYRLDALILLARWCLDRGAMAAEVDGVAAADLRAAVVGWEADRRRQLRAGR